MNGSPACPPCHLIGNWRIVKADLWDHDHLDLCGPAQIIIGKDGHGKIRFGAMQAGLDVEYSQSMVFFTWQGFDEMDEVHGSGNAELLDDGTLEIEFAYHNGDEATLNAKAFIGGNFIKIPAVFLTNAINVKNLEVPERRGVKHNHDQLHFRQGELAATKPLPTTVNQLVMLPFLVKFDKIIKTTKQGCDIDVHGDFLNVDDRS